MEFNINRLFYSYYKKYLIKINENIIINIILKHQKIMIRFK